MSVTTAALPLTPAHERALELLEVAVEGLPAEEAAGLLCACMVICLEMIVPADDLDHAAAILVRDTVFAAREIPGAIQ